MKRGHKGPAGRVGRKEAQEYVIGRQLYMAYWSGKQLLGSLRIFFVILLSSLGKFSLSLKGARGGLKEGVEWYGACYMDIRTNGRMNERTNERTSTARPLGAKSPKSLSPLPFSCLPSFPNPNPSLGCRTLATPPRSHKARRCASRVGGLSKSGQRRPTSRQVRRGPNGQSCRSLPSWDSADQTLNYWGYWDMTQSSSVIPRIGFFLFMPTRPRVAWVGGSNSVRDRP